jgi:hypothetical protein
MIMLILIENIYTSKQLSPIKTPLRIWSTTQLHIK